MRKITVKVMHFLWQSGSGKIKYESKLNEEEKNSVFSALHIIDPRIRLTREDYAFTYDQNGKREQSNFEEAFLFDYLPKVKQEFLIQILQSQRKIDTIVKAEKASEFHSQQVDFSFEGCYFEERTETQFGVQKDFLYNKGIIIEVDGVKFHDKKEQELLDKYRDTSVKETKWQTKRISDLDKTDFDLWINKSPTFLHYIENFNKELSDHWLDILQLTLSPFAIARVQKTIIQLILSNNLDLNAKEWNILAIERDVPCIVLAFEDLKQHFHHLFTLAGKEKSFPTLNLQVLSTEEFVNSKLHDTKLHDTKPELISKFKSEREFDLIIDIAVLQRQGIVKNEISFKGKNKAIIRSSHYVNSERKIYTSGLIDYQPITKKLENETYEDILHAKESLTYFLQNIFRKESFREGQLPILNRALQGKSVIGLLPTGGGKSLTYQIASLLQAGVTMVIDPIKSLMQDQYDNLVKNGIDSCNFINSKLTREEKTIATNQVTESKVLFTFVSPERLQIEDFRLSLKEMNKNNVYFSYCVIDEVHCVSEWGHDFRTSYLSLGRNAIEHCKTKNKQSIPIFGLTATASFDVLSDVERELSGNGLTNIDTDAIVRFENTNRTELQYQIVNTAVDFEREEKIIKLEDGKEIKVYPIKGDVKQQTALQKQSELTKVVELIPDRLLTLNEQTNSILEWTKEKFSIDGNLPNIKIESFDTNSFYNLSEYYNKSIYKNGGIVFCPHRTHLFGVTDKFKFDKYDDDIRDEEGNIIHRRGDFVLDQNGNKVKLPLPKRKAVADSLTKTGKYEVGVFMGSSDEDEKVGKEIETESFDNQRKFIENEQNIMVATKAFGMGIDKPNVRFTVHVNIPASIESFVQEAGRAGRDRKMALSSILFNQQKVAIFNQKCFETLESEMSEESLKILKKLKNQKFCKEEVPEILKAIGNEELIQNEKKILDNLGEIFTDKDNLLFFHNNSFKGQEKELVVINELLKEILLPNTDNLYSISEILKEEIGEEEVWLGLFEGDFVDNNSFKGQEKELVVINELLKEILLPNTDNLYSISEILKEEIGEEEVWLGLFEGDFVDRIYVNHANTEKFGFINIRNFSLNIGISTFPTEHSLQVLNRVVFLIKDRFPNYTNTIELKNWLKEKRDEVSEIGIEQRLNEIDFHQEVNPEIIVPFANKYADKNIFHEEFKELFKKTITEKASDEVIFESIDGTFENYLKNVKEKLNIEIGTDENDLEALKQLYYSPRKKPDTDKAIFRLSSIGIIDDYTVDYNRNCYTIKVKKKTDDEYKEALAKFMLKYYSSNRVQSAIKEVDQAKGNTVLQKCLSFLTNFVYEEIAKKRMRSIDDMILACEYGLRDNGNEELKEFIYLYFNSKYARQNYSYNSRTNGKEVSASLLTDVSEKDFNFKIVWKYIEAVNEDRSGSQIDNSKHLRGATILLLRDNLDNGALHLLKSFSLFVIGLNKNPNLINEAKESLTLGFKLFRDKDSSLTFEKLSQNIESYKSKIIQNANNSKEVAKILDVIIEELYLEFHNDWLKNFNQKYLFEYDR
jgi:superfamily II DNA helicase RecQ